MRARRLLIGLGAFAVPKLFAVGEHLLLPSGRNGFVPLSFVFRAGPGGLHSAVVRLHGHDVSVHDGLCPGAGLRQHGSFSFLYLANVLGAMSGTFCTAVVFVERLGFHHTLWLAAAGNFTIAFISGCLGLGTTTADKNRVRWRTAKSKRRSRQKLLPTLLPTGLTTSFYFPPVSLRWPWKWSGPAPSPWSENTGLFVRDDCLHLSGRDLCRFVDLSVGPAQKSGEIQRDAVCVLAVAAFLPVLANDPRIVKQFFWMGTIDPSKRLDPFGQHLSILRLAGIFDAEPD